MYDFVKYSFSIISYVRLVSEFHGIPCEHDVCQSSDQDISLDRRLYQGYGLNKGTLRKVEIPTTRPFLGPLQKRGLRTYWILQSPLVPSG